MLYKVTVKLFAFTRKCIRQSYQVVKLYSLGKKKSVSNYCIKIVAVSNYIDLSDR